MAEQPRRAKPAKLAADENAPWKPPQWTEEAIGAVQALHRGDAQPHQQKLALDFIVRVLSDNGGLGWHPTSPHEASFAAGRRYPGVEIAKAIKINLSIFTKQPREQG